MYSKYYNQVIYIKTIKKYDIIYDTEYILYTPTYSHFKPMYLHPMFNIYYIASFHYQNVISGAARFVMYLNDLPA